MSPGLKQLFYAVIDLLLFSDLRLVLKLETRYRFCISPICRQPRLHIPSTTIGPEAVVSDIVRPMTCAMAITFADRLFLVPHNCSSRHRRFDTLQCNRSHATYGNVKIVVPWPGTGRYWQAISPGMRIQIVGFSRGE